MKAVFSPRCVILVTSLWLLPAACAPSAQNDKQGAAQKEGEVKIEVLKEGDGTAAKDGDMVSVHYTGWLTDGTKFDSSVDRGKPFSFKLGAKQVIQGWDKGVAGMKPGEKRKLTIPPDLAYGKKGRPSIPPDSTLIFDVELLKIE